MDPMNNPMQNLNSVPNGAAMPDGGMGVNSGMTGAGAGDNGTMIGNPMMSGNASGAVSNGDMSGLASPMGSMDSLVMGSQVGTMQQSSTPVGGMNPGQMFQNPGGGVGTPMGALGAIPGDYSSANSPLLGATDPITMPAPPKAPDPVEEELKAPFRAAAPVPGSIGSAISMPGDPNQIPNVAFNDPAMMAPNSSMMPKKRTWSSRLGMDGDKKMDKKTMIILGSIVAVIVVAIVAVVVIAL